jgi:glycosyltransferase involved in cell wall biosynthesis
MLKKIALFGTYPPPYGGRSVHIKRLAKNLVDQNVEVHIYSNTGVLKKRKGLKLRKTKSILFYIFKEKYDILHFHDRNFRLIAILVFLSKILKYKTILTYHSFRDDPQSYNLIEKLFFRYCIKRIDQFICVGTNEKEKLSQYVSNSKIKIIHSYLHPFEDEEDYHLIPYDVRKFIENSNFLITANGNIKFFNSEDMYGFDLLIELLNYLVNHKGYHIQLLLAILGVNEQTKDEKEYYNLLHKKIQRYKLNKYVCIYEVKDTELFPILKRSKLFIRPTNTDSYGISIAEAIYAGIPAIASDVCKRPIGSILFKSRNINDLYSKTLKVFKNYECIKRTINNSKSEECFNLIFSLYNRIYNEIKYMKED